MAKYLVETYYTCTFKVNHYLNNINDDEIKNLEKSSELYYNALYVENAKEVRRKMNNKNEVI